MLLKCLYRAAELSREKANAKERESERVIELERGKKQMSAGEVQQFATCNFVFVKRLY